MELKTAHAGSGSTAKEGDGGGSEFHFTPDPVASFYVAWTFLVTAHCVGVCLISVSLSHFFPDSWEACTERKHLLLPLVLKAPWGAFSRGLKTQTFLEILCY